MELKVQAAGRTDSSEGDRDGGIRPASTPSRSGSHPRITEEALKRLLEGRDGMLQRITTLELEIGRRKARASELERAQIEAARWNWMALAVLGVLAAVGAGAVTVRVKR